MSFCLERRKHSRLELKAYGFNHACTLHLADTILKAHLIDISPGGARLRLSTEISQDKLEQHAKILLDPCFAPAGKELTQLHACLRWTNLPEVGIMFDEELPLGTSDLQRLLVK